VELREQVELIIGDYLRVTDVATPERRVEFSKEITDSVMDVVGQHLKGDFSSALLSAVHTLQDYADRYYPKLGLAIIGWEPVPGRPEKTRHTCVSKDIDGAFKAMCGLLENQD
jgi:hypothetical protein